MRGDDQQVLAGQLQVGSEVNITGSEHISFLDAYLVHFPLFGFIVNRRKHAIIGVLAFRVVERLYRN